MNSSLIKKITRLSKRYINLINPLKNKECCICNNKISSFLSYEGGWKKAPQLMQALKIIGSDLDNFTCPVCYSHDRERHQWLYWKATNLLPLITQSEILHFAPEVHLSSIISKQNPLKYIKADLYPIASDIEKIDMLAIPFKEATFDIVIANHVLEHVDDANTALKEIYRILKKGGLAILQTPYSSLLKKTWDDPGITTKQQRLIAYGQDDHVRLFGQDIFQIIENNGFISAIKTHKQLLNDRPASTYGVNEEELFMLFKK